MLAEDESLLGIITISVCCEHHSDDIMTVLGGDCATLCSQIPSPEPRSQGLEEGQASSAGCLAYILTLGVVDGYRRKGLARELLRRSIEHVRRNMPFVQAVYLHVVTYNDAAIQLYESMKFLRIAHFQQFYQLHGKPYDSYLYAVYVNNGRPPWKFRWRTFLGMGLATTLWTGFVSAWSSLWRS